jgi:hypothetical protein
MQGNKQHIKICMKPSKSMETTPKLDAPRHPRRRVKSRCTMATLTDKRCEWQVYIGTRRTSRTWYTPHVIYRKKEREAGAIRHMIGWKVNTGSISRAHYKQRSQSHKVKSFDSRSVGTSGLLSEIVPKYVLNTSKDWQSFGKTVCFQTKCTIRKCTFKKFPNEE